ncbi:glycosyltransferase family 4 protein [Paraclostridium sordellii]|uniref:glycosyltransferase family 4 protein n=1 Tax=Paraclostridium sordellii TaxID=1505 RepID=UPI0021BB56C0|nr:glycosyltransferase family 4 protein [Paeniclostridium sordellii]
MLFITNIPSPYRVDFFSELSKGIDLTVWFENEKVNYRQWKSEIENKNFKYKFLNFKDNKLLKNMLNLISSFKKEKYDLYIVGGYATPIGILSIIYLKITGKKFILNADGGFIKEESKKNYLIKKFFISSADYWISSGSNCNIYLEHYGAEKAKIFEYPFASIAYSKEDLQPISKIEEQKLKKTYNLNDIVILSVGSFIYRKGLDILIKAFEIVKLNSPELKISLVLIGGGELKKDYLNYISSKSIEDVTIIDFLDKDELIKFYKLSDLFILPTREDIWGLVVNEAMEFGLPIISSDKAGAAYDLIRDNGEIFKSEDYKGLAKSIENIILDKDKIKKYSKSSKEIIKRYSSENMAEKHIEIFNHIESI